jgi:hypothetical protein
LDEATYTCRPKTVDGVELSRNEAVAHRPARMTDNWAVLFRELLWAIG